MSNMAVSAAGPRHAENRRRWERLPIAVPVFVRGKDDRGKEFLEFTTAINISAGGALLATRRYLPRSSHVSLEIPSAPLPGLSVPVGPVRTLGGQVVQISNSAQYHLCGLQFSRPLV